MSNTITLHGTIEITEIFGEGATMSRSKNQPKTLRNSYRAHSDNKYTNQQMHSIIHRVRYINSYMVRHRGAKFRQSL